MTLQKKLDRETILQIRKYLRVFPFVGLSICLLSAAVGASAQNTLSVTAPSGFAVSPRVTDSQDFEGQNPPKERPHRRLHDRGNENNQNEDDNARQGRPEPRVKAFPHAYFAGVGANGYVPPDTNIAVGPNHIVETVNARYAIYDKNGALLVGPKSLSSLWTALGGPCATNNGGDPDVQYDKVADRWLITQLGNTSAPYSECLAVSQTSDPAGAYYLYSYAYNSTMHDYPKFGVWPTAHNSAYLATYNLFANGASFTGGQLCAFDRSGMLSGAAAPLSICYTITNNGVYLPSDLDGSTTPLDGTPAYFMTFETSTLRMYTLAPNFANPSASVLTLTPDLAVTPFSEACAGGTCIPQAGTTQQLDSVGDRLMYRLAFRMFPDHEALVVNHSVTTGSRVGVRWYELRAPVSSTGNFSVFQQGTFSPADGIYRWMGSAAMDQVGDIALGYSASSSSIHPAIRYTGRTPGDPAGTMGTEASLLEGGGSQTSGLSRWGDYTSMRIDPIDDCTFWYANEYLPSNGSFNWSTFIGSFKFPSCSASPDFSISASPSSQSVLQGASANYTVTVTPSGGFNSTVTLSATGLPAGATYVFNPPSVAGSGSSAMTVTTSPTTPAGSYTITVTGSSGSLTPTTTVTLVVNGPSPDFSITASPSSRTVVRSSSTTYTVTVQGINGFGGTVNFSVSGLPSRSSASFNPSSILGNGSSTMTVKTGRRTPSGTYPLTIKGVSGNLAHSVKVTLVVQ
ncbi:MAG: hypothetical protein DMG15_17885 [Acidobacteria bacterium]|nr:MAG: hypothetical protein DMG15_17885 [Acidobacteriota bacterium]